MTSALLIVFLLVMEPPTDSVRVDSVGTTDAHTVTVFAEPPTQAYFTGVPSTTTTSVDELMTHGSAMLIRRAAMAGEAMVGGLRGGQVTTSIDGMKVHSACVDKMDPATAYVELDNLRALDLTTGSGDLRYGSNLGGSLAFQLRQPAHDAPLAARVEATVDANAIGRTFKSSLEGSVDQVGARVAYTYRAAGDFQAGGQRRISGSNFEKHNALAAASIQLADRQSLQVLAIYDLATFIGYPALLMDTRRAEAMIGGVTWKGAWSGGWTSSVKVYANQVDHVMDDLNRSADEVSSRPFMPGMYMPMDGTSATLGTLAELRWASSTSVITGVLDLSYLAANASMDMLPIDTTIRPMQMTNIGDARVGTYGLNVIWEELLSDVTTLRSSVRFDLSPRTLRDQASREVLSAYRPDAPIDRTMTALSASVGLRAALSERNTGTVTLSTLERLPTHLEMYGFWLYDPQANMVTVGDPGLASERSWGIETGFEHRSDDVQLLIGARTMWISRYIASLGLPSNEEIPLRSTANVGLAMLTSADLSFNVSVSERTMLGAMVAWTYGQSVDQHDPLPLISPATAMVRGVWTLDEIQLEARLRGALAQNRTSSVLLPENATSGWFTADLTAVWSASRNIVLMASLRNLFDTWYHEHTSINDLASPGRSIQLQVRTLW